MPSRAGVHGTPSTVISRRRVRDRVLSWLRCPVNTTRPWSMMATPTPIHPSGVQSAGHPSETHRARSLGRERRHELARQSPDKAIQPFCTRSCATGKVRVAVPISLSHRLSARTECPGRGFLIIGRRYFVGGFRPACLITGPIHSSKTPAISLTPQAIYDFETRTRRNAFNPR